jgi:multidrug resistance efflux pump
VVRTHSATALANSLEYEGLFLMPLWRTLGKATKLFRGRTLPKTLFVITAVAAAIAFLCLYPAEFKLEGDGRLRPKDRHNVWAEVDGEVEEVLVEHDDPVTKGQVLVVQKSRDLEKQIAELEGQLQKDLADLRGTSSELDYDSQLTEVEKSQKESHINQLNASIASLERQLKLLNEKKKLLEVRSPSNGRVVTWNVVERLGNGRPVDRGEQLLEIADPTSDWELEVMMPESRMGHIANADAASDDKLPVTFFLALNPKEQLQGKVEKIENSAEVRGEDGNTVLVRVSFDQKRLREVVADPKIGATATAKIHCGKRAIGYVWLHDLVDFVRAKILFRLF